MSEMIGRVRDAIVKEFARQAEESGDHAEGGRLDGSFDIDDVAWEAIAAMWEPTKKMIYEGNSKIEDCIDYWNYESDSGYSVGLHAASHTWQTMINEALE